MKALLAPAQCAELENRLDRRSVARDRGVLVGVRGRPLCGRIRGRGTRERRGADGGRRRAVHAVRLERAGVARRRAAARSAHSVDGHAAAARGAARLACRVRGAAHGSVLSPHGRGAARAVPQLLPRPRRGAGRRAFRPHSHPDSGVHPGARGGAEPRDHLDQRAVHQRELPSARARANGVRGNRAQEGAACARSRARRARYLPREARRARPRGASDREYGGNRGAAGRNRPAGSRAQVVVELPERGRAAGARSQGAARRHARAARGREPPRNVERRWHELERARRLLPGALRGGRVRARQLQACADGRRDRARGIHA